MNKRINIAILLVLCLALSFAAEETSCKQHKAWVKAKNFIKDIAKGLTQTAQSAADRFAEDFEDKDASEISAEDLGVCSQFGGEKSCCTRKITKFIEVSALYKVKPLQARNNIVKKFLNALVRQINKDTCTVAQGKTKPATIDVLIGNNNLTKLQTLLTNLKTCKVNFAKAVTQFTRGALCSICAGVDKLSSYFDNNGNLLVSQSSSDAYQTAIDNSITCFADLVSLDGQNGKEGLLAIAAEVLDAFVDNTCKTAITEKITTIFTNNGGVSKTDGKDKVCSPKKVFSTQSACEVAQEGASDIDTKSAARLLREAGFEGMRVLQTSDDASVVSSGGVNMFVSSSLDSNIDANGEISTESEYDSANSMINKFFVSALVAFILVLY